MFVVSHNMNIERQVSDRTAIRCLGCVTEKGRTGDIFVHPGHSYTPALLSAGSGPDAEVSIEDRVDLGGDAYSLTCLYPR